MNIDLSHSRIVTNSMKYLGRYVSKYTTLERKFYDNGKETASCQLHPFNSADKKARNELEKTRIRTTKFIMHVIWNLLNFKKRQTFIRRLPIQIFAIKTHHQTISVSFCLSPRSHNNSMRRSGEDCSPWPHPYCYWANNVMLPRQL